MPIMTGRPAPRPRPAKPPLRHGVTGDPDLPPPVKAPSLQPHRPSPRTDRLVRKIITAIVVCFSAVALLDSLAPHDFVKPLNPSSVSSAAAACASDGAPTAAVETTDAGPYRLVTLTCADGLEVHVAR